MSNEINSLMKSHVSENRNTQGEKATKSLEKLLAQQEGMLQEAIQGSGDPFNPIPISEIITILTQTTSLKKDLLQLQKENSDQVKDKFYEKSLKSTLIGKQSKFENAEIKLKPFEMQLPKSDKKPKLVTIKDKEGKEIATLSPHEVDGEYFITSSKHLSGSYEVEIEYESEDKKTLEIDLEKESIEFSLNSNAPCTIELNQNGRVVSQSELKNVKKGKNKLELPILDNEALKSGVYSITLVQDEKRVNYQTTHYIEDIQKINGKYTVITQDNHEIDLNHLI